MYNSDLIQLILYFFKDNVGHRIFHKGPQNPWIFSYSFSLSFVESFEGSPVRYLVLHALCEHCVG
jgi:hypothetical protein